MLAVHEPLLPTTLGHLAGALVFGIFVFLLLQDRAGARPRSSRITLAAALLACLWNLLSVTALVCREYDPAAESGWISLLQAASASLLSLLPAVLLHLSLQNGLQPLRVLGYALSGCAVLLHGTAWVATEPQTALRVLSVVTAGFPLLTAVAAVALWRQSLDGSPHSGQPGARRGGLSQLIGTLALFLFSMSLLHFGQSHQYGTGLAQTGWQMELLAHHAGLPLALLMLVQDQRFLLLDAFVRVLAAIGLAAGFVFAAVRLATPWLPASQPLNPVTQALLLVCACLLLVLFAALHSRLQRLLTRLVFRRSELEATLDALRRSKADSLDEPAFLQTAQRHMAAFASAALIGNEPDWVAERIRQPLLVADMGERRDALEAAGVEAIVPVRLSATEQHLILLGRRAGGRRYFSEDLQALALLADETGQQVERRRRSQLQQLVAQAELRALQAQINPHFLFNAFNTLYGIIPKEAAGARRTVLNLADIFRYFLQSERAMIPLDEEMRIVAAYLEIESLRMGSKLQVELAIEEQAKPLLIPVLSMEPLVENAVKHGVASRREGGRVRVEARVANDELVVSVQDTGTGFAEQGMSQGAGVGLANVAQRLRLTYGVDLQIDSSSAGTTVQFAVPARQPEGSLR